MIKDQKVVLNGMISIDDKLQEKFNEDNNEIIVKKNKNNDILDPFKFSSQKGKPFKINLKNDDDDDDGFDVFQSSYT